ncbi:TPA: hypothetical protein NKY23_004498 [Vibrio parahaemolyticus]|nr:hypothetical protein [Vibrio parahaemolyticus]
MAIEFNIVPQNKSYNKQQIVIDGEVVYEHVDSKVDRFEVLEGSDKDISIENTLKLFELPIEQLPTRFTFEGVSPKKVDCMDPSIYISIKNNSIDRTYTILYSQDISIGNLREFQEYIGGYALSIGFYSDIEIDNSDLTITLMSEPNDEEFNTLLSCLGSDLSKIEGMTNYINENYIGKSTDELFISKFNFPPDYKNLCVQYLIWFGDLLTNLNISAEVWSEPHEGGTNFIISHDKDPELLEKIKEVFYQYIQLPYAEFIPASNNLSPKQLYLVTALETQVSNFKNQIQLKDASITYLEASVSSKDNEIMRLKGENRLLIESLEAGEEKVAQYGFLNGLLKVDKIQYLNKNKSISVDLSSIFGEPKD